MTDTRPLSAITVGPRHRREMGDISALAKSIEEIGLLQPIVITPAGQLIAGRRRMAAFDWLNRMEIPVNVIDLEDIILGEMAENTIRKDFTPSEAVAIGMALEERERERAKARQVVGGQLKSQASDNLAQPPGRTRDIIGTAVGMSGATYEAAKTVVMAAEKDPATAGPILAEMDRTGKVHPAVAKLRQTKNSEAEPSGRTRDEVTERYARLRQMAQESYRPSAIATALGMTEERVRQLLNGWGIPTVEQRIGKTARIDAAEILSGIISNAAPAENSLAIVDGSWNELPRERFGEWATDLGCALQTLNRLNRALRKELL